MGSERDKELLRKYCNGETLTANETAILESWYLHLARTQNVKTPDGDELAFEVDAIWEDIKLKKRGVDNRYNQKIRNIWFSAASVVLLIAAGVFLLKAEKQNSQVIVKTPKTDVKPGGNKAYLILADNTKISLEDISVGEIAKQAGTTITKNPDGSLVYQIAWGNRNSEPQYNAIETPKGGQYQVNLPDGTRAWLNSVSSIRFPTSFSKTERNVETTGEVYFEVTKNKLAPFIVKTGDHRVTVLGTNFNINAYPDEAEVKTTLLEGSVVVTRGQATLRLSPGQQSVVPQSLTADVKVEEVDSQAAIAWKNGYFHFNHSSLPELMRQFGRWYQVDVEYSGPIKNYEFVGKIRRDKSLSKVLNILKESGVNFKIEDHKLSVSP